MVSHDLHPSTISFKLLLPEQKTNVRFELKEIDEKCRFKRRAELQAASENRKTHNESGPQWTRLVLASALSAQTGKSLELGR